MLKKKIHRKIKVDFCHKNQCSFKGIKGRKIIGRLNAAYFGDIRASFFFYDPALKVWQSPRGKWGVLEE